ncbi:MAG: TIGR00730 family Rossman fold protein [Blastochloris sp.]|nr:TIGR00730 family Rossman fold protein [Blastochloris sp.]
MSQPTTYSTGHEVLDKKIEELLALADIQSDSEYFHDMFVTVLKFAADKPSPKDIKLFSRSIKEMRYASKVFQPYYGVKKLSIFGSARTSEKAAEYQAAESFARLMMEASYMVITGGGHGIMGAAQAGAGRERSFALNIELPFEQQANSTIEGDPKLINFRYFFTRKLHFIKNSHAIVLMPGGFGTMDEGFEAMTLIQTGKTNVVPVVLLDAPGGNFWRTFIHYIQEHLLNDGLISADDFHLLKVTDNINEARKEILNFYYNFHSYRYVGDQLVIRTQREIPPAAVIRLLEDFHDILTDENSLKTCAFLPEEINEPEIAHLPRLCLKFDRRSHGRLRQLIDRLNLF